MDLYSNIDIKPLDVRRIYGDRTLVIANNTIKEGYFFKDVYVELNRIGATSAVGINKLTRKRPNYNAAVGLFFGKNLTPISGLKFEGASWRNHQKQQILVFKMGGEVFDGDTIHCLTVGAGWVPAECGVTEEEVANILIGRAERPREINEGNSCI